MAHYYPYDTKGYYTGHPVEADTQPSNSSEWEPLVVPGTRPLFDGVGWIQVPALDSSEDLQAMKESLYGLLDSAKYLRDSKYGREEVSSWGQQRAEAERYLTDGSIGPYLTALSEFEPLDTLVGKIIDKVTAYDVAKATFAARIIRLRTQISTATDVQDLPDPADLIGLSEQSS